MGQARGSIWLSWVAAAHGLLLGCSHSKAWPGPENLIPRQGPHMAVSRRFQLLATWRLSRELLECPHDMVVGSSWASGPREPDGNCSVSYDQASKVTLCHFCSILLVTQSAMSSMGGDCTWACKPRGENSRWSSLRPATTLCPLVLNDSPPSHM